MKVVYRIDIMKSLRMVGWTTKKLREKKILGEATMQRLRHNLPVSFDVLAKLCYLLGCDISDILIYIGDKYEPQSSLNKKED